MKIKNVQNYKIQVLQNLSYHMKQKEENKINYLSTKLIPYSLKK